MGKDGTPTATSAPGPGDNSLFADDAYGFALYYNSSDYAHIGSVVRPFTVIDKYTWSQKDTSRYRPLYNGNIAGIINNIPSIAAPIRVNRRYNTMFGMLYQYDQLNRMTGSMSFPYIHTHGNFLQWDAHHFYYENVEYDRNGNILLLRRGGMPNLTDILHMDELYYTYYAHSNRLSYVRDKIPSGNYSIDLDSQFVNNYRYDAIGNLVRDSAEGITRIAWTVYGKIDSIYKAGGTLISYRYDAAGNRVLKKVNNSETVYVRDASGNVMSTYTYDPSAGSGQAGLWQKEIHLYGSSRLGIHQYALNLSSPSPIAIITIGNITGKKSIFERGNKFFETNLIPIHPCKILKGQVEMPGYLIKCSLVRPTPLKEINMRLAN